MKKSTYLPACLLTVICMPMHSVKADTLDALLNDVLNDVRVSEKTGACIANPYLLNASHKHAVAACKPIVAQCPAGTSPMPKLSKCTLRPSATDATILDLLKKSQQVASNETDLGKRKPFDGKIVNGTGFQCIIDMGFGPAPGGLGYTPFCFFDLSKVETIPSGGQRYAVPRYISQNLVRMSNGSNITISELNNPGNYQCYAVNFKSTARCLTLPAGLLNKLGFK